MMRPRAVGGVPALRISKASVIEAFKILGLMVAIAIILGVFYLAIGVPMYMSESQTYNATVIGPSCVGCGHNDSAALPNGTIIHVWVCGNPPKGATIQVAYYWYYPLKYSWWAEVNTPC